MNELVAGSRARAMVPRTYEEMQRMGNALLMSGTFKPSYKAAKAMEGPNGNNTQALAECCVVIQRGLDVGLSPTQAAEGIAIINGKTLIYGDTLTALLLAGGCKIEKWIDGEGDNRAGNARITRPDGTVIEKRYTRADARKAGLLDERKTIKKPIWDEGARRKVPKEVPNDSVWFRFEDRMLEWRAFGFAVKDGASDFSKGLAIMEEEGPTADTMVVEEAPKPELPSTTPTIEHEPQDEPQAPADALEDQEGFVDMLRSQLSSVESRDEYRQLVINNRELTRRCSKPVRSEIAKLYVEALGE